MFANNLLYKSALILIGKPLNVMNGNSIIPYFWVFFWALNTVNVTILFFINLNGKDRHRHYGFFTEDFAYTIGEWCTNLGCIFFLIYEKRWRALFLSFENFQYFGKTSTFKRIMKFGNVIAIIFLIYMTVGSLAYIVFVLVDENNCEQIYGSTRICGVINPTWWPFKNPPTLLVKRFLLVYQILSAIVTCNTFFVSLLIHQASNVIGDKADHLGHKFKQLCLISNEDDQFENFKLWVENHENTIRLCKKLNYVYIRTVGHVTLIGAATIAMLGYQLIKEEDYKYVVDISMSLLLVIVICRSGEIMTDKMTNIGVAVWLSNWTECNPKLKRWIPFILLRCQTKIEFDALPIGKANHALLLIIVKTSYSYLTLLRKTMNKNV
ncbi:hypothetical protein ABEB36_005797 [Hypothenemus hampei]|uniref:Odorant receptor n=1 Tax=Hypothenemus hampei TaxID=57062 RepID=A0ABD1EZF4_HYPHA